MQTVNTQSCNCYELHRSQKLIRIKQVQEMTGLSKSYIYQLAQQELFPKSILLIEGGSAVAWLESSIISWITSRVEASNKAA